MALPFIIGGLSAASSLIGDIYDRDAAKKAKSDALDAFKKLLIPSSETEARADRAGDTLYTKAMSELNSGAFAARGALNPETLKTIAYTKMAGSRAETEFQVGEEDNRYNRGIQAQIAQIEAQPVPTINPMNAIEDGVEGYFTGKQLGMAEEFASSQKALMEAQAKYYGNNKLTENQTFGIGVDRVGKFDVPQLSISGQPKKLDVGLSPEMPETDYFGVHPYMPNIQGSAQGYNMNFVGEQKATRNIESFSEAMKRKKKFRSSIFDYED